MRNADLLFPDLLCFVVALEDRDPEAVCGDLKLAGQEFPCPADRLALEIVAEGEVAEHLKEGAVTGGLADAFDIGCADALLAGGHADIGRDCLTEEEFFQRRHAGVDEQQ